MDEETQHIVYYQADASGHLIYFSVSVGAIHNSSAGSAVSLATLGLEPHGCNHLQRLVAFVRYYKFSGSDLESVVREAIAIRALAADKRKEALGKLAKLISDSFRMRTKE